MTVPVKLGKRPAREAAGVPHFGTLLAKLPPPPPACEFYSAVKDWGMLGNSTVGDCVEAASLHFLLSLSVYAGIPDRPTEAEALAFYSAATGYTPSDPSSDQGSYVYGPGGTMDYWHHTGIMCGGKLNKAGDYYQIQNHEIAQYQQAVYLFGGLLIGVQLPEAIVAGTTIPAVWSDYGGPVAGGHEIFVCGYSTTSNGVLLDLISWGQRYQCTDEWLLAVVDEAVVVTDSAAFNAKGVNVGGLTPAEIAGDLEIVRNL